MRQVVQTAADTTGRPSRSCTGCTLASEGICTQAEMTTTSQLAVFRRRLSSMGARGSCAPTSRLSLISRLTASSTSMPWCSM